jgi:hypothetical protein
MIRRIAIYVLNQRWEVLKNLYNNIVAPQLFDSGNIHELYHLLKNHFAEFTDEEKATTLEAIRQLPVPTHHDEPDGF